MLWEVLVNIDISTNKYNASDIIEVSEVQILSNI